jgi:hypothetical protein
MAAGESCIMYGMALAGENGQLAYQLAAIMQLALAM